MSKTPFMQLYVADYMADTRHLTTEQHGAYLLLLMTMWKAGGSLPKDPRKLARIAGVHPPRWAKIWSELEEFFTVSGDEITQPRLVKEYEKAVLKSQSRALSGSKGGKAKALKTNKQRLANAKAKLKHSSEPESEERDKSLSTRVTRFDEFWQVYPHRGGVKRNRKGSLQKYTAAVKRGVAEEVMIEAAKIYAKDRRVIDGYARDPVTWLNQEGWTDEPAPSQQNGGYDPQQDKWDYIAKHGSSAGWRSANA